HLLGAWGLRGLLDPTTEVKRLFFSLSDDALAPADDPAAEPAKVAALRAAGTPFREALRAALAATALLEAAPRHRASGYPLSSNESARCGGCVWRSAGGLCRQAAPRGFVREGDRACARFEAAL